MNPVAKKSHYKIIIFILIYFVSFKCVAAKIGFVDMERLINNSPQISNARATISSEFEVQYDDVKQKEADLEMLELSITKNGAIMQLDELSQLQERARMLERQIRRAKEDLRDAITIRNNQILVDIHKELNDLVTQYAIDNDYDAILINAILYVNEEMDITNAILLLLKNNNNTKTSNEN
ncbi:MAG: OmpH family outer membrane protein [Proteobacteria bacterium]|nr:OmpH family outer membrane protein [Pseudomonadota bacterium]